MLGQKDSSPSDVLTDGGSTRFIAEGARQRVPDAEINAEQWQNMAVDFDGRELMSVENSDIF